MSALVAEVESLAATITDRVLEEMYRDPFWDDRFGTRGRVFAEQDGRYHLAYLCTALRSGDSGPLVSYAAWLQSVLTTRGMCTRHLDENFARIASVLEDMFGVRVEPALSLLAKAREALLYPQTAARALQLSSSEWAARALQAMGPRARPETPANLAVLLSYMADAVALGRGDVFFDYVRFAEDHLVRRGAPRDYPSALLAALRATLPADTELAADARSAAEDLLVVVASSTSEPPAREARA